MAEKNEGKYERLPPPGWDPETKSYDDWRFQVELWVKACVKAKLKGADCGYRLYDKLKDVKSKGVGDKVTEGVRTGDVNVFDDEAVTQLLTLLDKSFKKDDLSMLHQSWTQFIKYRKSNSDSVDDFLNTFAMKAAALKRDGVKLPEDVLGLQLIDAANLEENEAQLVLTAVVDYEKRDELYEQAEKALRKFLSKKQRKLFFEDEDEEDVNYTNARNKYRGGRGSRGGGRSGFRGGIKRGEHNNGGKGRVETGKSRKLNPLDEDGNPLTCHICNSVFHFAGKNGENCPESYENLNKSNRGKYEKDVNEVTETQYEDVLLNEIGYNGLLDTCCSASIMGVEWKDSFFNSMSKKDRKSVKELPADTYFRFGGKGNVKSMAKYEFPVYILGKRTTITADVVQRNIPLLISKGEMKARGFVLDTKSDTLRVGDASLHLDTTEKGHYKLPLSKCDFVDVNALEDTIENQTIKQKRKIVVKLHRQFGHLPLDNLLKNAGVIDPEIFKLVEEVYEKCELCQRYKKTKPRPIVCLPLASRFNEAVAMDLKVFRNGDIYFIHFIDMFTRFSKAKILRSKKPTVVVKAFIMEWISMGFGAPERVLVDNGGEFNNPIYLDAMEQYNIEPLATAANSPWSNGICERNHHVVDTIVYKLLEEEPSLDMEIALANAVSAKNCLANHNGFAPVQLVTGQLPNLPSVLINKLPALEEPETELVLKHLNAMHSARQAFMNAECSERIKRGLKHPVRAQEEMYHNGEKVFFKSEGKNRWKGEASVIGQLGKIVFVRFGSRLHRVPTCRLLKKSQCHLEQKDVSAEKRDDKHEELSSDNTNDSCSEQDLTSESEEEIDDNNISIPNNEDVPIIENQLPDETTGEEAAAEAGNTARPRRAHVPPSRYIPEDGNWKTKKSDEEVNIVIIPKGRHLEDIVVKAKEKEMQNWKDFEVTDEVEDKGQKTISTRWVVTEKEIDGKRDAKARLVVRGFEEEESHTADAPTASKATLRVAFAIAANEGWSVETIDIKGAFLQGNKIEREIYIDPPDDFKKDGIIWRLRKTVYGLNDAARAWYFSLVEQLLSLECKQSQLDKASFRFYEDQQLAGLFVIHVDDLFVSGNGFFKTNVVEKLVQKFHIGTRKKDNFKYVGIDVKQEQNGEIRITQSEYINEIAEIDFEANGRGHTDLLKPFEVKKLRSLTGQVLWASGQSRIDACFDALELSVNRNTPRVETLKRANKVVRKLKTNKRTLLFKQIDEFQNLQLIVFADASFANLSDGVSSAGGYLILMSSTKLNNCCILDWCSGKIKRVVDNTLEAEAISLRNALGNAVYLGHMITEFYKDDCQSNYLSIQAYTDNKSLETNIRSTKQPKGKRLRVDLAEIRRMINEKEINDLKWVESKKQLADGLTKRDILMQDVINIMENGYFVNS